MAEPATSDEAPAPGALVDGRAGAGPGAAAPSSSSSSSSSPSSSSSSSSGDASATPPEPAPPRAASPTLEHLLAHARRRLVRAALAQVAVGGVAGLLLGLVVALGVIGSAPFSFALRDALLALVVVAAAGGVALAVQRAVLPLSSDGVVGAALEAALRRRGLDAKDLVRGALELRDRSIDDDAGRSRALCDAHIARTATTLHDGGALESLPGVALERAVPTLLGLALAAGVLGGWAATSPAGLKARLAKLFDDGAAAQAAATQAAQQAPLVTDLTITLRYPAYMARADDVIAGSSGDVTAPRGTEVLLQGRADRAVRAAALIVTGGEKELALDATVSERRNVAARFVVAAAGTWRFRLTEEDGDVVVDPVAHRVLVKDDAAPQVRLEEPASDRVVQPDEKVDLAFSAEDDVGLTIVKVVVRRPGGKHAPYERELLKVPSLRTARGTGSFDVKDTGARPGETLAVTIEAVDNDDQGGPNVGRSATRVLTVFSAAKHHDEVIARLDALLGEMTEVLGDELEAPFAADTDDTAAATALSTPEGQTRLLARHRQVAPRAQAMRKTFDETLTALARDERADDGVRRALANMRVELARKDDDKRAAVERTPPPVPPRSIPPSSWRRLIDAQRAVVQELEKDILYLDDLVQRERVQQAQKLVADMKQAQKDLKSLVEQYKESGDPTTRDALLEEIRRLQAQMQDLARKLAELRRELPDEQLNDDAFRGEEMFEKASTLDEMIEEGRLDDAAAALEQMIEQSEKMVDELERAEDDIGGEENKALREKLERFSDELKSLAEAQKQQLEETEAAMEAARKKLEEKGRARLEKALAEAQKKTEKAEKALAGVPLDGMTGYEEEDVDAARANTADLKRALASGDVEDALRAVEAAESAARSAEGSLDDRQRGRTSFATKETRAARDGTKEAADLLQDARKLLEDAMPDPSSTMDAKDRERLERQAERQQQLGEQAQKLSQLMQEVGKEAPIFGPDHQQGLQQAQQSMERAGQQLKGQGRPRPAPGGLRGARQAQAQALQKLSQLQEALQKMGSGSGGGSGMPLPLPGGGAPEGEGRQEGQRGRSNEEVKIPDGSDFKVKDAFRKDILDAMREGVAGEWAGEVKKYYEELIK